MGKENEQIMVVPRDVLFNGKKAFEGFADSDTADYESVILDNCSFMRRGDAEINPEYKQPIAYCFIVNHSLKKIFVYTRSFGEGYNEDRLRGKWSCGIGGHIEKMDAEGNPIYNSMLREISEEVDIAGSKKPRILGYINYEGDAVSQVHFALVYLIETDASVVTLIGDESSIGRFESLSFLEELIRNSSEKDSDVQVEMWTKLALEPLRNYFKQ
jgi:predicted NUDIX family phosphoesterase